IDAARAHALGLVNQLSAPGQALARALVLARRIGDNAPLSVQASLQAMNGLLAAADAAGWEATAKALAVISGSADYTEGVQAFFERRVPVWQGR
ncbi:MAG: enoyl-CoA hydratase, partial [Betaproteobacteria bacterium]|nr:enoyl-CoA hydratase [Betaproteobacteria bacterium]